MLYHYDPLLLLHSNLADSQKGTGLTDQILLICYSAKKKLREHTACITAFCIRMYRRRRIL